MVLRRPAPAQPVPVGPRVSLALTTSGTVGGGGAAAAAAARARASAHHGGRFLTHAAPGAAFLVAAQASSRRYAGQAIEVEEEEEEGSPTSAAGGRGASLASFVPAHVLQSLSNDERKRQEGIFEVVSTESIYVRKLRVTIRVRHRIKGGPQHARRR